LVTILLILHHLVMGEMTMTDLLIHHMVVILLMADLGQIQTLPLHHLHLIGEVEEEAAAVALQIQALQIQALQILALQIQALLIYHLVAMYLHKEVLLLTLEQLPKS
jgi:hypothetical protein